MIFNTITSSSMTLSEGNRRHSFRICFHIFHISHFDIKSLIQRRKIFCCLHFPNRAYLIPSGYVIPKKVLNISYNGLFFPQMSLIKLNLYPPLISSSSLLSTLIFDSTLKHLSKPFIRSDWHILRKLWHTEKIRLKKFITKQEN